MKTLTYRLMPDQRDPREPRQMQSLLKDPERTAGTTYNDFLIQNMRPDLLETPGPENPFRAFELP